MDNKAEAEQKDCCQQVISILMTGRLMLLTLREIEAQINDVMHLCVPKIKTLIFTYENFVEVKSTRRSLSLVIISLNKEHDHIVLISLSTLTFCTQKYTD